MKCHQVLLEIRGKREKEFIEYKQSCSKIGSLASMEPYVVEQAGSSLPVNLDFMVDTGNCMIKRRSILVLELPFQTDSVSVNEARIASLKPQENELLRREKTLESWAEQYFRNHKNKEHVYKKNQFVEFLKKIWPKFRAIDYIQTGEQRFGELQDVPFEDIGLVEPRRTLLQGIDNSPLEDSSKKVYRSIVKNLCSYARIQKKKTICGCCYKKGVSLSALSGWLEYLEGRCLKASSEKPYRDLIEVRLLFYVPLNIKELGTISLRDIEEIKYKDVIKFYLKHRTERYRVPSSFVDLAKALYSETEPLLRRTSKELGDFMKKSVKAAKIQEKVTPRLLQSSQKSICRIEGYVENGLSPR